MYETECSFTQLSGDVIPDAVRAQFVAPRGITHVALVQWEEHCTECAWPACYTSCDLYNPRNDGNCRRTLDGFSPVPGLQVSGGRVVRVQFKHWGCLTTKCNLIMHPVAQTLDIEAFNDGISRLAQKLPKFGRIMGRQGLVSRMARKAKRQKVKTLNLAATDFTKPTALILDMFNPQQENVALSLIIGADGADAKAIRFQRLVNLAPGFQNVRIEFGEIEPFLNGSPSLFMSMTPNLVSGGAEGLTLFFGTTAFVVDSASAKLVAGSKSIKVMVWDLDNTVWDGVLVEEGLGNVTLKPGIREVISELDQRGIVNGIASKNDADLALAQLEQSGLKDYFVFPEIHWGPKSQSIERITQAFNVGADTIGFIDDSPFEREEVKAAWPKTRIYGHDQYRELLSLPEFNVPVTAEAKSRRSFYRTEEKRHVAFANSSVDYLAFLKASNVRVTIEVPRDDQIARIHELVQRTNQLNFSGNRYSRAQIEALLADPGIDAYLVSAVDNYGSYGQVGLAVVKRGEVPRVVDLAFSCRVQSKMVEHGVLRFLVERYRGDNALGLEVFFRRSDRNQQVGNVLADLGFDLISKTGTDEIHRIACNVIEQTPDVIRIEFSGLPGETAKVLPQR